MSESIVVSSGIMGGCANPRVVDCWSSDREVLAYREVGSRLSNTGYGTSSRVGSRVGIFEVGGDPV